jgi:2-dehydropantoate 2-reductase
MSVHILGLGSIGTISAHLLTLSKSHKVYYLPRKPTSRVYTLIRPNGRSTKLKDIVQNDTESITPIDILLITTKANHTKDAFRPILKRLTKHTLLIFLQNGMGIVDSLRYFLPSNRIVLGTTTHAANRTKEDRKVHWVHEGKTFFAAEPTTTLSPEEIALLTSMGEVESFNTLEMRLFKKLALNACINPTTALFNLANRFITDSDYLVHELAKSIAKEIQAVYAVVRPEMDMSSLIEDVIELAGDTGDNISSMLADVRANRDTEIDFINGYIIKMGHKAGVEVIENEAVVRRIKGFAYFS